MVLLSPLFYDRKKEGTFFVFKKNEERWRLPELSLETKPNKHYAVEPGLYRDISNVPPGN